MGKAVKGWQGELELLFQQRQGQTSPVRHRATAPLKLQRPFYPDHKTCQSVIVHTAGGMVGGDRLAIDIQAEAETQPLITTAAANKVYRSAGPISQQAAHLTIGAGALLEWLPQETIIFDQAQYQQSVRVDLAPEAIWLGWDLMRLGRSARGERFSQGQVRSHTEVWRGDMPLWIDRQWIEGGSPVLTSPHGFAGYPVIASFALVGKIIKPEHLEIIRSLWPDFNDADMGVTALQSGMLCRYRGTSTQQARTWFVKIWRYLKPYLNGKTAYVPRVWGL
ncbi:MAG: urease accessory protein UreD [Cyanobacteria bacterium J06635_1]